MFDPFSDRTIGYHLFLEPTGALCEELQSLIATLAAQYKSPTFPPHITLLTRIPEEDESVVVHKARTLAAELRPITLALGDLLSEQQYFRALYSNVVQQDEMKKLHAKAAVAYSMETDPNYVAHLSLLYGNYPEEVKAQTRSTIPPPKESSFTASTLHVYKTHGTAEEWYKVEEFTLGTQYS